MNERLFKYFNKEYSLLERKYFYDYIEAFINEKVETSTTKFDTDALGEIFREKIKQLNPNDFSFLLMISGYIPEIYKHDSSFETLFSKLIEILVSEWAYRIGFIDSATPKLKSSKEDVTIRRGEIIIVCDAKSFRLGRSQGAPNVKDTIKKGDYDKWRQHYSKSKTEDGLEFKTIGGLITFPSMHKWKGASDAYLYCSDRHDPICILFYEHLAYYIVSGMNHQVLIDTLNNYPKLFPVASKNQLTYFERITNYMFAEDLANFEEYLNLTAEIVSEQAKYKLELIETQIADQKVEITERISKLQLADFEDLKKQLIESETTVISQQLHKQKINIAKFRLKKES